ncbi:MAG: efflux transporter periplasmic adaptor subunit [Leptolyngbya sp. ERB_1_1]
MVQYDYQSNFQTYSKVQSSIFALLLIIGCSVSGCRKAEQANANAPPPAPVKVQKIDAGTIEESSEFVGSLEAPQRVTLQPQIQGRIESILVRSGQRVQQGTPIISLSLDQTEANVASSAASASAARAATGTAEAQLAANEAAQSKAAANVQLQQTQFNRYQSLVNQGAAPRQQLDVARNNLQAAIADLQAAQKQVNASQAQVNQAQANVKAAEAQVAATQVNVNFKRVVAPVTGVVGDFPVKAGDFVNVGQTLTTIIQTDAFDLNLSIPANRSAQLRSGLPVELIDPNTKQRLALGSIGYIAASADPGQQTILSKGRFPNPNGLLRDGQFVQARVIWNRKPGVLIPTEAVSPIGGQNFVFVAVSKTDESGKTQTVAHQVPVNLGSIQGQSYQVLKGLQPGDSVIVSGVSKLKEGAAIAPQENTAL